MINMSLFDDKGSLIEKVSRVKVENSEFTVLDKMKGKKVPKAILLNSDDWGYGQFFLDE